MPTKRKRTGSIRTSNNNTCCNDCLHESIQVKSSAHAIEAGYSQPDLLQRRKAQGLNKAKSRGKKDNDVVDAKDDSYTFPAPLVLPGDDLALDPKYPPQSVLAWTRLKSRQPVTSSRRTIYVVAQPQYDAKVAFAESWSTPVDLAESKKTDVGSVDVGVNRVPVPRIDDVVDYIRAFYHPLPVKVLPRSTFRFVPWSAEDLALLKKTKPIVTGKNSLQTLGKHDAMIGLQTPSSVVGIRSRATTDRDFPRQLNLDDLLDAVEESLPMDAYAIVMLVNQDLYEDEEDEFVCGRAYGGSRIAVVSTARYSPVLDSRLGLDSDHEWPLSHCATSVNDLQRSALGNRGVRKNCNGNQNHDETRLATQACPPDYQDPDSRTHSVNSQSPIHAAIHAAKNFQSSKRNSRSQPQSDSPDPDHSTIAMQTLWLSRICRTTTHELGHCFGVDHCTYYACSMQGSASLREDHRQPAYLCPIDMSKILRATGAMEADCLKSLLTFCEQYEQGKSATMMFVAYAAWLRARLRDIDVSDS